MKFEEWENTIDFLKCHKTSQQIIADESRRKQLTGLGDKSTDFK